jgi:hypothetical protein
MEVHTKRGIILNTLLSEQWNYCRIEIKFHGGINFSA